MIPVDDPDDPRLAEYRSLPDAELRRRIEGPARTGEGIFVAEGTLVIRRLLASPYRLRSVLVTPRQRDVLAPELEAVDAPVYVADQPVMNRVAGFDIHRGAVASADRRALPGVEEVIGSARLVAVLEDIVDHENLGGIFRNAAAFGVGAVLLSPRCADPLYRRSVRVSMGNVLHVPFTRLSPWPSGLATLRRAGFRLLALTPAPHARPLRSVTPRRSDRVAVMLGTEGPGLSGDALGRADELVRIPMAPGVDSLNVATAAAIAFHHLAVPA